MPWKNGGGTTLELLKITNPDRPGDFILRISKAWVGQDGPFSIFEDIDRHLLILEGQGIRLNDRVLTSKDQSFLFKGEEQKTCSLINGPVVDFNVMVNRNWAKAEITRQQEGQVSGEAYVFDPDLEVLNILEESENLIVARPVIVVRVLRF